MRGDNFTRKIETLQNRVEELKRSAGKSSTEPEESLVEAVEELHAALKELPARQELEESQRAYSTLLSNLPGMAYRCSCDRDWTMQFVSEGCFDLTGYQPDELVQNRKLAYAQLIHPDDRERVWNEVQVALQGKRPFRIVYRIITAVGEEKRVWEQGCGVFSSDRGLLALEGFITDITEQKRAEGELQQERDFAESLIETAQVIVLVLDCEGRIVRFNPYMEKISGYRLDEVQGKDWFATFLPERDNSRVRELFLNVARETETRGVNPIITKNGQERYIEWSSKSLKGAGGNVVGVLSIGQDITEKNRLQKQLMESDRLAAIGATAAKLAHEIGNPLNGMYMTAELLDRRLARQVATLDDTVKSSVQKLKDEIARLDNLLREFGSLARREKYRFRPISLATLCGEIYALEQDNFNALHIHVEQDFPKDLPLVLADSDRLQQVLLNLYKNAVEAMLQGGTLAVRAHHSGEHVVLEIVDTGVGIPPELDIFEPFTTTKPSGTGLGLMIVRQIVSAHGGTITYDSQPGKGTIFRLMLPLNPSPQKSVEGPPVGRKD